MESFDNFNDSASQYGIVDDTSSMFSGYTNAVPHEPPTSELDSLSISDTNDTALQASKNVLVEDDFDGVLDDLKEEGAVDLPPHACR